MRNLDSHNCILRALIDIIAVFLTDAFCFAFILLPVQFF
jgi:hypothetical protein